MQIQKPPKALTLGGFNVALPVNIRSSSRLHPAPGVHQVVSLIRFIKPTDPITATHVLDIIEHNEAP